MNSKFFGINSLFLFTAAIIIGLSVIYGVSSILGLIYLLLIPISIIIIIYSYCTKCPQKENNCAHVFPGMISRFMPDREGRYNKHDIMGTIIPVLVLILFPQYWLWQKKNLFILFWVLIIIAFIEIVVFVCKSCENRHCSLCRKKYM